MPTAIDYSKQHVLLIDSSGILRSIIKDNLRNLGFIHVTGMTSSRSVLDILEQRPFDIVLLGHNLNDSFSGMQLFEEARYRGYVRPTCSWVFMTSDSSQGSVLFAMEAQPDDILIKPFSMEHLQSRLDILCRRHAALAPIEKAIERNAPHRAIQLCDSLLAKSDPNYEYAQLLKGRLLIEDEQYDKAEPVFERYYWAKHDLRQGLFLAQCQYQLAKFDQAKSLLKNLLDRHPLLIPAYDLLARIYEAEGDLDAAQELLSSATQKSPLVFQRFSELGRVAVRSLAFELAEKSYRKSITLGEGSCQATPEPYIRLANVQRLQLAEVASGRMQKQRLTEIEQVLSKAQRRFSEDRTLSVQSILMLAQVHDDLGEQELVTSYRDQAQQLATEANLAIDLDSMASELVAEQIPEIPKVAVADESVEPRQDIVMSAKENRIGVRNYLAGKPGQAIRYFGLAFEHDQSNGSALLNLAQLFLEAARDTPSRRDERMKMYARYMRLSERLSLQPEQREMFEQLSEYGTMILDNLPEGPLGSLLK